jgi:16S rRNA (cytidine1402-2'-O)-methyltransferase
VSGRLVVCATPIGNLGDVTLRVLDALREADTIAAEDTRVTRKLLARYEIATRMERCDEHTVERQTPALVERLKAGEVIALVSDAGTPGVSDPGSRLVDACLEAGVEVEVLPGASAILAALVASGLPTHAFFFGGFLPRKAGERRRAIELLGDLDATLIFYESPHRSAATLGALAELLPGRDAAMARELTKLHEEVLRAPLPELAEQIAARDKLKGEVVLVVGPPPARARVRIDEEEIHTAIGARIELGDSRSAAVKQVANDLGLPKSEVYELAHKALGPSSKSGARPS